MQTTYQMFTETIVPNDELIVSRTDLNGKITYANETFAQISGYEIDELIGKPHNIVRHPDMPHSVFKTLWETIKRGEMWKGYVKNLRKDGGYYWVYAEVSRVFKNGVLVEYKSIRTLPFTLPFLDEYIIWILKLSPAIISMAGLFNIWYTNFLSIFWWS